MKNADFGKKNERGAAEAVKRSAHVATAAGIGKTTGRGASAKNALKIIPLGGLNEIGKNITALEFGDHILVVDCGMSFPEDEMFGIDIVIPDFSYLEQNSRKVKGLILTHGHEDHIGAIPYLLKKLKAPIYGTKLTLGLVESKLTEHKLKADLRTINAGTKFSVGPFDIEAIRVTHSIADALCFAIETPVGLVFHTGDFKVDYTPVDGEPIDFLKLAEVGRKGVLLMLSDSTNAIRKGYTESEQNMGTVMENIFRDTESRIIVATFASNVHRIQTIIGTAMKFNRKVALSGRSMLKVLDLAMELGYIKIPKNVLVDQNEIRHIPDKKLVIITTGSQGEPMSALARMANNDHRAVSIKAGDKIILSSSPIPGNEKTVSNVVNKLLMNGAEVIYSDIADIHVSGHACQEELKLMLSLIKPEYFMPVHGEYRHLHRHAMIAEDLGIPAKRILLAENGQILEVNNNKITVSKETVPADPVFVDGLGVGDIGTIVLQDRKLLSESGLIIVVATIDGPTGRVVSGPEILSRGFVYVRENEGLMDDLRAVVSNKLREFERGGKSDRNNMKNAVREVLRSYIYTKTKRNPVILTIFTEA
ncbi:MAG: ribonuclease J [Clostridiales Family XIII bacterium]|nr:ribonuclease J [Clostridiales Family XIII bacterium]